MDMVAGWRRDEDEWESEAELLVGRESSFGCLVDIRVNGSSWFGNVTVDAFIGLAITDELQLRFLHGEETRIIAKGIGPVAGRRSKTATRIYFVGLGEPPIHDAA